MVGLCYLPTAERVSVTVVKLGNLNPFGEGSATKPSEFLVFLLKCNVYERMRAFNYNLMTRIPRKANIVRLWLPAVTMKLFEICCL
jgi:hypothetical protein